MFCLCFSCCKSQELKVQKKIETNFKEYVINSRKGQSKIETEHYLNNEAKFILQARNDFFSNMKLSENTELNLVEFFDTETPSSIYKAIIQYNSRYYFFIKDINSETQFKELAFESLKEKYNVMTCVLSEMDKPEPNKIMPEVGKASYHFTVYITKVNTNGDILTYMPKDICVTKDNGSD